MRVTVNGEERALDAEATVGDLLRALDLAPARVAVEVNRELVPRRTFDQTGLREGDAVEVVTFVGGG